MGCNSSKLHRFPVVAFCRERCRFLEEALCHSYALADAHVAYMESLKTLGPALHKFFIQLSEDAPDPAIDVADHKTAKEPLLTAKSGSPSSSDSGSVSLLRSGSESEANGTCTHTNHFQFLDYHETLSTVPDSVDGLMHSGYYWGSPKPVSSPPPPPSNSKWDFFNFFETYERYDAPYILSRSKSEDAKLKCEKGSDNFSLNINKEGLISKPDEDTKDETCFVSEEKELFESKGKFNTAIGKKMKGVSELMEEMEGLLLTASESGNEVLEMLDVGNFHYHQNIGVNSDTVSCKLLRLFTSSSPVTYTIPSAVKSFNVKSGLRHRSFHKDTGIVSWNLASTMKKLCIWEKKLYVEVQAVEKLHILHEKKCRQLRQMNKKGADPRKVESIAALLNLLSTKMNISIHMIDNMSTMISKLIEEELWPHVNNLILRLAGMWKAMLNCSRSQCQVILEVNDLTSNKQLSTPHLAAAIELKHEIQKWKFSFLDLIYVQKAQVKALNNWLQRCLLHRSTETPDASQPFSPGRIGAPPLFAICNQWSVELEKLSDKEVSETLQGVIIILDDTVGQHTVELQQQFIADPELERTVKFLESEEQKMLKVMCTRVKKLAPLAMEEIDGLLTGQRVLQNDVISSKNLHLGLQGIFAAIEGFSVKAVQVYEKLCQQIEESKHV